MYNTDKHIILVVCHYKLLNCLIHPRICRSHNKGGPFSSDVKKIKGAPKQASVIPINLLSMDNLISLFYPCHCLAPNNTTRKKADLNFVLGG